jgi:hypothetical protein
MLGCTFKSELEPKKRFTVSLRSSLGSLDRKLLLLAEVASTCMCRPQPKLVRTNSEQIHKKSALFFD